MIPHYTPEKTEEIFTVLIKYLNESLNQDGIYISILNGKGLVTEDFISGTVLLWDKQRRPGYVVWFEDILTNQNSGYEIVMDIKYITNVLREQCTPEDVIHIYKLTDKMGRKIKNENSYYRAGVPFQRNYHTLLKAKDDAERLQEYWGHDVKVKDGWICVVENY